MTLYFVLLKWLHIIGACVLLGTGAGIAFFMLMAHRTKDARFIAQTASVVVIADWVFTASAVLLQPITGILLALEAGWPLTSTWILSSIGLYVFVGVFWLPVVWIQLRMRNLARTAAATGANLPPAYHRLFRIWFACGFPAFFAVLSIIGLMIAKPA